MIRSVGRRGPVLVAGLALLALVLATLAARTSDPDRAPSPPPSPTSVAVAPSASPTPSPSATPSASPSPTASPGATAPAGAAPTKAEGFALRKTVVPMAFPLAASVRYRYVDDFLVRRIGRPTWYNHVRGRHADGSPYRAHDGVDVYAPRGTRLLAVFSGTVIDPAARWRPWTPARFGLTVVIVSDEPTSPGYVAWYAHLDRVDVKVGDHVVRGQAVGRLGLTGNATGRPSHVHFELRAPFLLTLTEAGERRSLDAFDPYPSLAAADPKRSAH